MSATTCIARRSSSRSGAVDPVDPVAFERLYDEFSHRVYAYCTRVMRSPDEAADATQDAFISMLRHLDALPCGEPGRSGYVFTVARNACFDMMRRRKRTTFSDDLDDDRRQREYAFSAARREEQPEEQALAGATREILVSAMRALPERHRRVLVLREFCDLSYEEIAEDMGLNRNCVAQLLSRARAALARQVASTGEVAALATV